MSGLLVRQISDVSVVSPTAQSIPRMTISYLGREVVIPATAHTLAGFRAWAKSEDFPERGRISFIGTEIFVDMSPEELEKHSKVKGEITRGILNLNKKRKAGEYYPDGALVTNVAAELSTVPDSVFVKWISLESGQARLVPREGSQDEYIELEGTPDWVLEIVSKTSVRKDTKVLRERYHRARIPEYWLIDARGDDIDFQFLVWEEDDYVPATTSRGGWQTSLVFGRRFRLHRHRDRMGFWEYTLQVKSLR